MQITIRFKDGSPDEVYESAKAPWQFRDYTVIDRGHHVLAYVPNSNILDVQVPELV